MEGGRGGGGPLLHLQEDQPAYLRNRGEEAGLGTAKHPTKMGFWSLLFSGSVQAWVACSSEQTCSSGKLPCLWQRVGPRSLDPFQPKLFYDTVIAIVFCPLYSLYLPPRWLIIDFEMPLTSGTAYISMGMFSLAGNFSLGKA